MVLYNILPPLLSSLPFTFIIFWFYCTRTSCWGNWIGFLLFLFPFFLLLSFFFFLFLFSFFLDSLDVFLGFLVIKQDSGVFILFPATAKPTT